MGTFNDLSQLKRLKSAPSAPTPPPLPPEDRTLAAAANSSDYFSALLGGGTAAHPTASARKHRTTVVTPATLPRVREELAEDARAAERAAFQARETALREEIQLQKDVSDSLAADLAAARLDLDAVAAERNALQDEKTRLSDRVAELDALLAQTQAECETLRIAPSPADPALVQSAAEKDREIARLRELLAEAQRTSLSSSVLLEKPDGFSEKFTGEIREHVLAALSDATDAAEAAGRDRRARILEAVLGANLSSGELERRRSAVCAILKDTGGSLNQAALSKLETLGFRYISGNKHHKLEWAGVRFPLSKTPSDVRACLNSAAEICNRVF